MFSFKGCWQVGTVRRTGQITPPVTDKHPSCSFRPSLALLHLIGNQSSLHLHWRLRSETSIWIHSRGANILLLCNMFAAQQPVTNPQTAPLTSMQEDSGVVGLELLRMAPPALATQPNQRHSIMWFPPRSWIPPRPKHPGSGTLEARQRGPCSSTGWRCQSTPVNGTYISCPQQGRSGAGPRRRERESTPTWKSSAALALNLR